MRHLHRVVPPLRHPWHSRGLARFVPFAPLLYRAYRRCVPLAGNPALRNMIESGVPRFLQRPLEFLLAETLAPEEEAVVRQVERLRTSLIGRGAEPVRYYNFASGDRLANSVSWERIGTISSVTPYWGTFLHLCAKAHGARTVLELGSCAGISSCYLAASPSCKQFMTIEGSPYLASVAMANLAQVSEDATVITASFDDALDELLPSLGKTVDCVFIDGHHEGAARLHYTRRVTPAMRPGSLMIWDDIHWTPDLWEAWRTFARTPGVSCAINLGRFGLAIWNEAPVTGTVHDFSAFSGYWGKGKPKPAR